MKIFFALILSAISVANNYAQKAPIEKLFDDYISEITSLNKTKDISRITQFFDERFKSNETTISIKGKQSRKSKDLEEYIAGFEGLITTDKVIELNLKIEDITNLLQESNNAVISANFSLDVKVDGRSLGKDDYRVNMAAFKTDDDQWKFFQSDVVRIVNEVNAGECYCFIYTNENRYVTEFYYPSGLDYSTVFDVFRIEIKGGKRTIAFNSNEWKYEWKTNGEIVGGNTNIEQKIGLAKDPKEAITSIMESQYSDVCTQFFTK